MLVRTHTGAVVGVDGLVVRVEVDLRGGLPTLRMVGLPDTAVREAGVRVCSALENSGFAKLEGTATVNFAPADVKKQGSGFDLAVGLGLAAALGQAPSDELERLLSLGELALDGTVRPVRGVLPKVAQAVTEGFERVMVPRENAAEAALVERARVYGVGSLREAVDLLSGEWPQPFRRTAAPRDARALDDGLDLADVKGQRLGKRALEIAAAGGHHVLLSGPPGAGKSLLAMRLPTILPGLDFDEAMEVTKVHSVAGLLDRQGLIATPPFRAPHHSISPAAMAGGGYGPSPGEISLAHRGVLFLDELPEFARPALECLRQPLEAGYILVRRVNRVARFPARFTLAAAMNPCPCGFLGAEARPCRCTPGLIDRYQAKISGPLLDRIDLRVPVRALRADEMLGADGGESSKTVRARVETARRVQSRRFRHARARLNGFMTPRQIERHCRLDAEGERALERAVDALKLSTRAFHRVLKVARTIADLAGAAAIEPAHLQEALVYRSSDGKS